MLTSEYSDEKNTSVCRGSGEAHSVPQPRDWGQKEVIVKRGSLATTQVQKGGGRTASRVGVQRTSRGNGGVPRVLSLSPLATQPQRCSDIST